MKTVENKVLKGICIKDLRISLLISASIVHLFSYFLTIKRIEPFQYFTYLFFWWSYILILDSLWALKGGKFTVFSAKLPSFIIISSFFWCIFELINIRIQNWFYVALPDRFFIRLLGYLFSYGTVIPAIFLTREIFLPLFRHINTKPFPLGRYNYLFIPLGLLLLFFLLLFPLYLFPLAWIFLFFITEGFSYKKVSDSFIAEIEKGKMGNVIATALSGLLCGFLWESWNSLSIAKWIYSVPFFEKGKIFEMPFLGYLGFIPFAFETISFFNLIKGLRLFSNRIFILFSILFSLFTFPLIDRYTVFSYLPKIENLYFLDKGTLAELKEKGVWTSYAIDPSKFEKEKREKLCLIQLKGLGIEKYRLLEEQGIETIEKLAKAQPEKVKDIWKERNIRRVRVFIEEAKKWQKRRN